MNCHFLTAFFIPSRLGSVICVLESTGFLHLIEQLAFPCHGHSKSNHILVEIRKPLTWARSAASTTFQFPKISAVTHSSKKYLLLSVENQVRFILFIQLMFIDDQPLTLYYLLGTKRRYKTQSASKRSKLI